MRTPILVLHILGGTIGVLAGFAAVAVRKGGRWHQMSGLVFVASMLTMSSAATYLALRIHQTANVIGGMLTFYMVATAWMTAKRRDGETSRLDWGVMALIFALGIGVVREGLRALSSANGQQDTPPGAYFFFGAIALLAGAGDLRMLMSGGVSGSKRLTRHLWRMCFAWFVASGSIFLARPHLFPAFMRTTGMLTVLGFLPLGLMIFWLIRVRVARRYRKSALVAASGRLAGAGA